MMRMLTGTGRVPPTRSMTRSCRALSNFACRRMSISEISSSSSVPPSASSNLPTRRAMAPVKAPFSWPKSSDSRRLSGMAAQLMETKVLFAPLRLAVHVTGKDLLAGAGFARDQDRGLGGRDLFGKLHDERHRLVAIDQVRLIRGHGAKHRGDQIGIGRQRDVFLRAGPDGVDGGPRVRLGATGGPRAHGCARAAAFRSGQ